VRDVVALLIDMDDHILVRGQVGTIVERLTEDHFEVEFAADDGRTYAQLALRRDCLLVLHHSSAKARSATRANDELAPSATPSCTHQRCLASNANGVDGFYGDWPGDETDEQLAAALRKSK